MLHDVPPGVERERDGAPRRSFCRRITVLVIMLVAVQFIAWLVDTSRLNLTPPSRRRSHGFPQGDRSFADPTTIAMGPSSSWPSVSPAEKAWQDPVRIAFAAAATHDPPFIMSNKYTAVEREIDSASLKRKEGSAATVSLQHRLHHMTVIMVALNQDDLDGLCRAVAELAPQMMTVPRPGAGSREAFVDAVLISADDRLDWRVCDGILGHAPFAVDFIGCALSTFAECVQTAASYVEADATHVFTFHYAANSKQVATELFSTASLRRLGNFLHDSAARESLLGQCRFLSCMVYNGFNGLVVSSGLEPMIQLDGELRHYRVGPFGGYLLAGNHTQSTALPSPTCMVTTTEALSKIAIPRHLAPGSRLRRRQQLDDGGTTNASTQTTDVGGRVRAAVPKSVAVASVGRRLVELESLLLTVGWYHVGSAPSTRAGFSQVLSKAVTWMDAARDVLLVTDVAYTRAEHYTARHPMQLLPRTVLDRLEANMTALAVTVVAAWQAIRAAEVAQASMHALSDSVIELSLRLAREGPSCSDAALRYPLAINDWPQRKPAEMSAGLMPLAVAASTDFEAMKISSYLAMRTHADFAALRNVSLPAIAWYHQCCYCCGFSNEIVHLIAPLQRRYNLMLVASPECFCAGFPPYTSSVVNATGVAIEQYVNHRNAQEPVIWISHTTPVFYPQQAFACNPPSYFVGRSMFEFTPVPEPWLIRSVMADEIWVPSVFVLDAFLASGFPREKLVLVPEAIDASLFTPHRPERFVLPHCTFRRIMNPDDCLNIASNVAFPDPFANAAMAAMLRATVPGPPFVAQDPFADLRSKQLTSHFKFLSAFKWELRKGWDVLLKSYFTAFKRRDPVTLYIATSIFSADKNEYKHFRDAAAVVRWCHNISDKLGLRREDVPAFIVITSNMDEEEVAALYRSVDAFVLPSRGEGWGLPVMQAMASGLPTIATDYSGQKDFLLPGLSYPIRVKKLEPIPLQNIGVVDANAMMTWAVPDERHCAELMRHVFENRAESRAVGIKAAAFIAENYDEEPIFKKFVEPQLQRIARIIRARPAPQGGGGVDC